MQTNANHESDRHQEFVHSKHSSKRGSFEKQVGGLRMHSGQTLPWRARVSHP